MAAKQFGMSMVPVSEALFFGAGGLAVMTEGGGACHGGIDIPSSLFICLTRPGYTKPVMGREKI
ncbi:MAG: hypothetical protein COC10_04930 [Sphingobium sp.]|nr:MAG: hypothetical protein COC10_04930 [Sphingobium sp.]